MKPLLEDAERGGSLGGFTVIPCGSPNCSSIRKEFVEPVGDQPGGVRQAQKEML
jgi:hypothetical protein